MTGPDERSGIDAVFQMLTREIWIVTAADGPRRGGLLATWVAQASLNPEFPMVLIAVGPNHFTAELIEGSGAFGLNLMSAAELELTWPFGLESGRDRDKLAGIELTSAVTGTPLLADCLGWLDCKVIARYDAGDHVFYWADVVAGRRVGEGSPLTDKDFFAAAGPERMQRLFANLQEDLRTQRPLLDRWRESL